MTNSKDNFNRLAIY